MGLPDRAKGVNVGSRPHRSGAPQSWPFKAPELEDLPRLVLFVFHKERFLPHHVPSPQTGLFNNNICYEGYWVIIAIL